ncbi:MAG TPA: mechanosensitive ion channel family protein [Bacillota bacterium]|nr:mechanosensitive ion channel family protein [Bacillota bacterium]
MLLSIELGWSIAISIGLIAIFILFTLYINRLMKKQETPKKGIIWLYLLDVIMLFVFLGFIMWMFGYDYQTELNTLWSNINSGFVQKIGAIIGTVITIFLAMFIIKVVNIFVKKASTREALNKKRILTILKVTKSIVKYTVDIIALLVVLALWGVNVMPALAGLGVLGIIIGMGTQSLIKDFISGFFIILEHHFDVGDIVEINGWKGEVVDIGLKSTKIKNWKQDIMIFANGSITDTINYSLSPSTAIIDFGIAYKEDIQKTIDLLKSELPKYRSVFPEIIEDPVVLGVTELANSSVNMRVIIRTETEKHYAIERAVRQGIKELLDKNNIEIPFPQVVVHQSEE